MNHLTYWGFIMLVGTIHLIALSQLLLLHLWLIFIIVIPITLYLSRKIIFQSGIFNKQTNMIFFTIQLLILFVYFTEPSYLFLIPFALFIVIEVLRHLLINQFDVLKQQNKQFEEIRDHYNETFRIVRSERHDFLKHISALHFMLEKDQFIEVKKYLDGLVEKYEETNLSIKGEKGVVAGILNQAYRKATSLGISVYYDLEVPISSLPMKDHDLVSLIGNVLSNSIEASEEWQNKTSKQALLSLEFYKRSGLYVLICKNDSLPIPTTILDQLFKTYGHSTKKGTHEGLGTKIISDLVDQYGGFLDFTYKQEQFTIKIKIPAITN